MDNYFFSALQTTTHGLEGMGILVIVGGLLIGAVKYIRHPLAVDAYNQLRSTLGRAILLGLELLVAADIIDTVAVQPSFSSLGILAGIILIRTFLSLSLEVEIEGRWPWRRDVDQTKR